MTGDQLKKFLDKKVSEYNRPSFIESDPVCIPHLFSKKQDIEIAGLFAAVFAWGIRTTIINKSKELMHMMDNAPYDFCRNHEEQDLRHMLSFKHRTFNGTDLLYFLAFLKLHYQQHDSLETAFIPSGNVKLDSVENGLNHFYRNFFGLPDVPSRTKKHIAAPHRHSACKRLNMYLRWMVRNDKNGVDFGIWKKISPAALIIPVDLHVARVARQFNMLTRKQTDWQAALDLTAYLRSFDPRDPVKYDYALFALGILEKF